MNRIYLDYSATTPVDKKVLDAMLPYFSRNFGNPSSIHGFGQEAAAGVERAREQVAEFLNCSPDEVIFTSGATESDNLAIKGVVKALLRQGSGGKAPKGNSARKLHIITSAVEHSAVLEPCLSLGKEGVEVTYLGVESNGVVDAEELKKAIRDNTVLVSVMYVNSEVGSVQPISKIGKIIKKINNKRLKEWRNASPAERGERPQAIYFHTDAAQAVNFFNCDVKNNYIDLLSLSGHKIYGPKGVGALYVKSGAPLSPLQLGGHHERGRRSGTLNAPSIVGLGKAIEMINAESREKNNKKIAKLRDKLIEGIMKNIPDTVLNTDRGKSSPAHAHFSFLGAEGESILISLDLSGIAVSTGSACASGQLKPSAVLLAMGIKPEIAHNSIRFSLGKYTTEEDIRKVIRILPPIIKRLRGFAPKI